MVRQCSLFHSQSRNTESAREYVYKAVPVQETWKKVKDKIQKILNEVTKVLERKAVFFQLLTSMHLQMFLRLHSNYLE